jgi:tripartite ATP-independent transporter DctM subunit
MIKQGYPKGFTVGVTVASSTMGMIIPPSVPMLMYAMSSGASVGKLFLAGVIPGVLIGLSQLLVVYGISRKNRYHPPVKKFEVREAVKVIRLGLFAVVMPVILVLSISLGIATASESAGVAVLYACLVGFFVYRELTIPDVVKAMKKTVMMSSSIMIIVGFSMLYIWILAVEQVPAKIAEFILAQEIHRYWVFIFLDLLVLFIGTFVDVTPSLLLLCPILIPIMKKFGMMELQFGAVMIVGLAIGLVTPPVGMCLNVATKICDMPITQIFKHAVPWLICNIIILVLITFIPELSTWLPALIG